MVDCYIRFVYLYEQVLALFKIAAMFCQTRCDNSGVGDATCAATDVEPSSWL